jgi:hypothetical protein
LGLQKRLNNYSMDEENRLWDNMPYTHKSLSLRRVLGYFAFERDSSSGGGGIGWSVVVIGRFVEIFDHQKSSDE